MYKFIGLRRRLKHFTLPIFILKSSVVKKKMNRSVIEKVLWSVVLFLTILNCLSYRTLGQVTFSRDWNAGKRSGSPDLQCSAVLKSVDEICKVMVEEFRQLAACETKSMLRFQREYDDKQADMFLEGQDGR